MKDVIYVAAFLLALAGPTVVRAHQRNTGWQVGSTAMAAPSASQSSSTTTTPAEPLLGAPTVVRQFLQPSPSSTSPIPNQLVANPSTLVHSPIVAQAVNKHSIVAVSTVQRYNENNSKYDPNQSPSPNVILSPSPSPIPNSNTVFNQFVAESSSFGTPLGQPPAILQAVSEPTIVAVLTVQRHNNYESNYISKPISNTKSKPNPSPNPNPKSNTALDSNLPAAATGVRGAGPIGTSTPLGGSGKWCIEFNSDSVPFYFTNQAPFPTLSGDAGQADQCFPSYDTSGAMFIGPTTSQSGAGGTKLECNFPVTIGQGPKSQPNCDISLVDGYSLSLACTGPGSESFGNSENLWTKATCPIVNGDYCTNSQGYAGSQDNVDQFFKNAYPDYRIWVTGQTTQNDAIFTQHGTVKCKVSGGKPSAKKGKRDNDVPMLALDEMHNVSDSGAHHRHKHKGRAHARGWRNLMRGIKPLER